MVGCVQATIADSVDPRVVDRLLGPYSYHNLKLLLLHSTQMHMQLVGTFAAIKHSKVTQRTVADQTTTNQQIGQ